LWFATPLLGTVLDIAPDYNNAGTRRLRRFIVREPTAQSSDDSRSDAEAAFRPLQRTEALGSND
jgi:hypothetical protein